MPKSIVLRCIASLTVTLIALTSGCQTVRPNQAAGTAIGTLAGSITGAAIGASEGKSSEGALIGAVTGGALGSIAGNSIDRENERDQLLTMQYQRQSRDSAVDINDVIQMSQSGLNSDVIVNQIRNVGSASRLSTNDLILLKNNGVDDQVIKAMQTNFVESNSTPAPNFYSVPVYAAPVIPEPFIYRRGCRPRRRCGPRSEITIDF